MSNTAEVPTVKRGRGRPRKNPLPVTPAATDTTINPAITEEYDDAYLLSQDLGDVQHLGSWTKRSGVRLARREDYGAGQIFHLPDLNPPATLVAKDNPTQQFNRAWLEEDGSRHARQMALVMRQKKWRPALAEEFIVCPDLRDFIQGENGDGTGRLVYADLNGKTAAVVMVRTKEDYEADRRVLTRHSDDVQKTAEEKMASMQENLRRAGLSSVVANSKMEDE